MLACGANVWNLKKNKKCLFHSLPTVSSSVVYFCIMPLQFLKKGKILNFIYVKLRLVVSIIKNEKMGAFESGGHQGYTNT